MLEGVQPPDLIPTITNLGHKEANRGNLPSPNASRRPVRIGYASQNTYQMAMVKERLAPLSFYPILKKVIWFITALCYDGQSSGSIGVKTCSPLFGKKRKKTSQMLHCISGISKGTPFKTSFQCFSNNTI